MYNERPAKVTDNVDAVRRGLTTAQKDWLKGTVGAPTTAAPALAELQAIAGIARRAIIELQLEKSLDGRNPSEQQAKLSAVAQYIGGITAGAAVDPLAAYAQWSEWKAAEGELESDSLDDLCDRLRGRIRAEEAATAGTKSAVKPAAPKTNATILAEELGRTLGLPAPKARPEKAKEEGSDARVKAILVLGGQVYRGHNSGTGLLDITYELISKRVQKMEDWSTTGCAEAYALDQWVYQQGFGTADEAYNALAGPRATVKDGWIAAMDARGATKSNPARFWTKRMPCENCQQWLKALGITADRTGKSN